MTYEDNVPSFLVEMREHRRAANTKSYLVILEELLEVMHKEIVELKAKSKDKEDGR